MRAVPATLAALIVLGAVGARAVASPQGKLNSVDGNVATAGNGYYNVHVERLPGSGVGLYTATTGPLHSAGGGLNVLFGSGTPGTSYSTIRSYTSQTDYVQVIGGASSSFVVVPLDGLARGFVPMGTTGFATIYTITGRDALTVVQIVRVNGATEADSAIEVTTAIKNDGPNAVDLGLRNLWDFKVGQDDGPPLQEMSPLGGVLLTEAEFAPPSFESFRVMDNELTPGAPTLAVVGTVSGPRWVQPPPSPPDMLRFVCWQDAHRSAFDYTVNPSRSVATTASNCPSTSGGGDSAAAYYWGTTAADAIRIPPGGAKVLTAALCAEPPPSCTGVIQAFGQGCAGSGNTAPDILISGCAVMGNTLTLDVSKGLGGAQAALLLGVGRASNLVGACTLSVPQPMQALPIQLSGTGSATVPLAIPGVPQTVGVTFTLQAFVVDAGALSGVSATSALQVFIGF